MLKIIDGRGFHLTLDNNWTVSVQWGPMNYCDHYMDDLYSHRGNTEWESKTAEVWAFENIVDGKHHPENPLAYQTADEVVRFINEVSKF